MYTERYLINQCTRGNTVYAMTKEGVNQFLAEVNDYESLSTLFTDFSQYILSLRIYPINFRQSLTRNPWGFENIDNVCVGDKACEAQGYKRIEDAYSLGVFTSSVAHVDLLNTDDNFEWQSYDPYVSAKIYIPFCGYHDIDINSIMNKYIQTEFCIDVATGLCTAYLFAYDTFAGENPRLVYQTSFQLGIDCPFSTDGEGLRQRILAYTWIKDVVVDWHAKPLGGSTGGWMGAVSAGAQATGATLDKHFANAPKLLVGGSYDGSWNRTIEDLVPHIILAYKKPVDYNKNMFVEYRGYKTQEAVTSLAVKCGGFTKMNDIHLDNFPTATKQELDEIEELLLTGVILP